MPEDPIALARHNKPIRYLAVALAVLLNGLFILPMAGVILGFTVMTSDPEATAADEALVVLGSAVMFLVVPWLSLIHILKFKVELTKDGILKTSPTTGRVFIPYEEIRYVKYSNLLEWFIIRGPDRRIWMAPYLEGFEPFVRNLWEICSERRLSNLTRVNILGMKYATALGADLRYAWMDTAKGTLENRVIASKIREEELKAMNEELEGFARAKKAYPYPRILNTAAVLALSAGALSAWPWLDMLLDPSYEEMYYANLTAEGWAVFILLMAFAAMGFVALKMIIERRLLASIIATSMACIGLGAIFGLPALLLLIAGRKGFKESDRRRSTRRRWDQIPALREDLWNSLIRFNVADLWPQRVSPGRDIYVASATLKDGTYVPCAMFVAKDTEDQARLFPRHGFSRTHYKFDVERMIDADSVESISESPNVARRPDIVEKLGQGNNSDTVTKRVKVQLRDGKEYLTVANWIILGMPKGCAVGDIRSVEALQEGEDVTCWKGFLVPSSGVMLCIFRPPGKKAGT